MQPITMVAMSGGVDSSVCALLLKRSGRPILGMFMKNWEEDDPTAGCGAEQDAADARAVAERLGIEFHARNLSAEYWEEVFECFLAELSAGRTPNPDILCNREIKFGTFIDHAADLGAERIATGHYACCHRRRDGRAVLHKGADPGKDQSYFLYALSQEQLRRVEFPIGELNKSDVRHLAEQAGLPIANKKDSTGICFIGERNFNRFVDRYLPAEPGDIVNERGERVGRHRGLFHYTLGQRKGLQIGGLRDYPEAPWYVAVKDIERNCLVVVQDSQHRLLLSRRLEATELNWIAGESPPPGARLAAKIRYRQADQPCRLIACNDDRIVVEFEQAQRAATPGQSVVLYDGQECLGGGIIDRHDAPHPLFL